MAVFAQKSSVLMCMSALRLIACGCGLLGLQKNVHCTRFQPQRMDDTLEGWHH